jgi:hypothetical protein
MFNCICVEPDVACDFYQERVVTARLEHHCCECQAAIAPGEKYEYVVGVWDGNFDTYKTCLPCAHVRADVMSCGFIFGMLWEDIRHAHSDFENPYDDDWLY